jgi:hypothetical protein
MGGKADCLRIDVAADVKALAQYGDLHFRFNNADLVGRLNAIVEVGSKVRLLVPENHGASAITDPL